MKKPLFQKVCIVGVGLIGGSIGMAVKQKKLARFVLGVVRRKQTAEEAFMKRALDIATLDLKEGIKDADLVILCSPVSVIESQIRQIAPHLKKGALVIDVGSSKGNIESAAKKFLKKNTFVGCHPMAGSEKTGVSSARADLFKGSVCFVASKHPKVETFWKELGAKTVFLSARPHDALVARTSHTPHALAFSLFQSKKEYPKNISINPSLRELTRLAQSNPELWADIFKANRQALLEAILEFEAKGLKPLKNFLRSGKTSDLGRFIATANKNAALLKI